MKIFKLVFEWFECCYKGLFPLNFTISTQPTSDGQAQAKLLPMPQTVIEKRMFQNFSNFF